MGFQTRAYLCGPRTIVVALSLLWAGASAAQTPPGAAPGVYIAVYRTPRHVKYSDPAVFQSIVDELMQFLESKHVVAPNAPQRYHNFEAQLPADRLARLASNSGTAELLYVTVDRPIKSWVKVTVQCFDEQGSQLWKEESASSAWAPTGKSGVSHALVQLEKKLTQHSAGPCLTVASAPPPPTPREPLVTAETPRPAPATPEPAAKLVLEEGTPVRLVLLDEVSSKTAKAGDPLRFRVLDDVRVNALTVIAHGAEARGKVHSVVPPRIAMRSANITVELESAALVTGDSQPLTFRRESKGRMDAVEVMDFLSVANIFGLPFLPFFHGGEVQIPKGAVVTAFTAGGSPLDSQAVMRIQPTEPEKRTGPATLIVYSPTPQGNRERIWIGQVKAAEVRGGERVAFNLQPGEYWLRGASKRHAARFVAEEGGQYYARVAGLDEGHYWVTRFDGLIETGVAEVEVEGLAEADRKHVYDISKVPDTKLRAKP